MLDFRLNTFLTLAKIGSYTKSAEALHITQPAVSQHIRFLEEYYGGKLFEYQGKSLALTERGQKLYDYALSMRADSRHLRATLREAEGGAVSLSFGATLSIGEFICPDILSALLRQMPDIRIKLPVENTEKLLEKLKDGEIDFALIEGSFDKSEYGHELFSRQRFIGVCAADSPLAGKAVSLEDLAQSQRLIMRESGSGTRAVLEQLLLERNLSTLSFCRAVEIGNLSAIKQLVSQNLGISFMYEAAARKEIEKGELTELIIDELSVAREFNFVYLKNTLFQREYLRWFDFFKGVQQ